MEKCLKKPSGTGKNTEVIEYNLNNWCNQELIGGYKKPTEVNRLCENKSDLFCPWGPWILWNKTNIIFLFL